VPPKPRYGRGHQPKFEREKLRVVLREFVSESKALEWVEERPDAPADFVLEGELSDFHVHPGRYEAMVSARLMDSHGKVLARYSGESAQSPGGGSIFNMFERAAYGAVYGALRSCIPGAKSDLSAEARRLLSRSSAEPSPGHASPESGAGAKGAPDT
jgi:hypothetical protein